MNQYDAIFREILNDPRSQSVRYLTDVTSTFTVRPTHAGWRTGRSVDFLAEVHPAHHIHIEIQSTNDATMHWRMLNYYVLLSHRLHGWKSNDFVIDQYMFYVGDENFTMKKAHPLVGAPYKFEAKNIEKLDLGKAMNSSYYGDWILGLFGSKNTLEDWVMAFDRICLLQDQSDKLSGLFFLNQLAPLREADHMISERLNAMGLFEAMEKSPVTGWLVDKVTTQRSIDVLNRCFSSEHRAPVSDQERLILETIPSGDAWEIATEIAFDGSERDIIMERGAQLDLI
ncbi:hypothetical protein [Agrobacterium rosae]|uniref:hypothetical protein n=1 Tax=Agrobacterium rosae TaxID=1972867 RepID=UPI003B9FFB69